jgi:hypothetical protein
MIWACHNASTPYARVKFMILRMIPTPRRGGIDIFATRNAKADGNF